MYIKYKFLQNLNFRFYEYICFILTIKLHFAIHLFYFIKKHYQFY